MTFTNVSIRAIQAIRTLMFASEKDMFCTDVLWYYDCYGDTFVQILPTKIFYL
jgi:hypothetical protein